VAARTRDRVNGEFACDTRRRVLRLGLCAPIDLPHTEPIPTGPEVARQQPIPDDAATVKCALQRAHDDKGGSDAHEITGPTEWRSRRCSRITSPSRASLDGARANKSNDREVKHDARVLHRHSEWCEP
jgi:hypothetical protein